MKIALIAHDKMKPEMIEFATRYKDILAKHELVATGTTGHKIIEATGLNIRCFKSGPLGGDQEIGARVANGKIDLIFFFRGNKFDVLVLYLVTTALSLLILLIIWQMMSFQIEDALSNILQSLSNTILYYIILLAAILADLLILAPLTNLWWTRLYMVRNGMLNSEEMKDPQ